MLHPVILCGGSGSRLWPISRSLYPKQFMEYAANTPSLFTQTLQRVQYIQRQYERSVGAPIIICNEEHRFFTAAMVQDLQIPGNRAPKIILEPKPRNTAPAIALVALAALEADADAILLVLPSDHALTPDNALIDAVAEAREAAELNFLVTFGISPESAHPGYGYIQYGELLDPTEDERGKTQSEVRRVARFIEKPCIEDAELMLEEGGYLWNSGMFMFRADAYLNELEKFMPDMADICRHAWALRKQDVDFIRPDATTLSSCPEQSIDYAVMEHTAAAAVLPLNVHWSDLGTWESFYELGSSVADPHGNVSYGDVLAHKTKNSYIHSGSRLVATLGLEDMVVVETADAVLVASRRNTQDVKTLVNVLAAQGRKESLLHQRVFRPWGYYESIAMYERFQVKRIVVNPGASLSLQMHHHRAEHWVVVSGTAEITLNEDTFFLSENQSTYIPPTCKHRLKNPGIIPLAIIEIQSGAYLGEDDIQRFDDVYGRHESEE